MITLILNETCLKEDTYVSDASELDASFFKLGLRTFYIPNRIFYIHEGLKPWLVVKDTTGLGQAEDVPGPILIVSSLKPLDVGMKGCSGSAQEMLLVGRLMACLQKASDRCL